MHHWCGISGRIPQGIPLHEYGCMHACMHELVMASIPLDVPLIYMAAIVQIGYSIHMRGVNH